MQRQDFDFELPPDLIAQDPACARDGSLLLDVPTSGPFRIDHFPSIVEQFRGDEVLVVNDTKVVPARVLGHKTTGGRVEMFFVEALDDQTIHAMMRGKRLREGTEIELPEGVTALIEAHLGDGVFRLQLTNHGDLWAWLERAGQVPLPPYIQRTPHSADEERYQTVFARNRGAVAAPTAGLHFTDEILGALQERGVTIARVTLHVGLGTFMPMRVDHIKDHKMHSEAFEVPQETRTLLASGRPIVAVGTTVVRALESYALQPDGRRTELFIYPGFEFKLVDGLLTNFHLPQSTLLMMVSAFSGRARVLEAYGYAVEHKMRFFSYGDAMLLRRENGRWR
ncbi:MAG: tRNA preQ1(34) S-adenosylmethionine ribosyltransferase-isomerase QueA [Bradymonadia bacterium]